jgi:outer membrane lipoprotein SlyB
MSNITRHQLRRFSTLACALMVLTACTTTDKINAPIVDLKNASMQDRQAYQDDLNECSQYAKEVQTAGKVGVGAAGGAVVGGAVGAIFGGSSGAAEGAGAGAVFGGARGAGDSAQERSRVIKNCLRARGYNVLN